MDTSYLLIQVRIPCLPNMKLARREVAFESTLPHIIRSALSWGFRDKELVI